MQSTYTYFVKKLSRRVSVISVSEYFQPWRISSDVKNSTVIFSKGRISCIIQEHKKHSCTSGIKRYSNLNFVRNFGSHIVRCFTKTEKMSIYRYIYIYRDSLRKKFPYSLHTRKIYLASLDCYSQSVKSTWKKQNAVKKNLN